MASFTSSYVGGLGFELVIAGYDSSLPEGIAGRGVRLRFCGLMMGFPRGIVDAFDGSEGVLSG